MADIKQYTDEIKNAVYGEQVRDSIINALNRINSDNNVCQGLDAYEEREITVPGVETEVATVGSSQSSVTLTVTAEMIKGGLTLRGEESCTSYLYQISFYNDMSGSSATHTIGSQNINTEGWHADVAGMLEEYGYTLSTDWRVTLHFEHIEGTVHILTSTDRTIKVLAKKEET